MSKLGSSTGAQGAGWVTVLFRGRREKIKIETRNSTFGDVLKVACGKFQTVLEDSSITDDMHVLHHKNKAVDLSLPYRFTGISNNAVVDMTPRKTAVRQVHVQIKLDTGRQFREKFRPSCHLAEIVEKCGCSQELAALVYLRHRIESADFGSTTLLSLGLRDGSVSFRGVTAVASEKPTAATAPKSPMEAPQVPAPNMHMEVEAPWSSGGEMDINQPTETADMEVSDEAGTANIGTSEVDVFKLKDTYSEDEARVTVKTLYKIISMVLKKPNEPKVRQLKLSNDAFFKRVGRYPIAVDILKSVGFVLENEVYILRNGVKLEATLNDLVVQGERELGLTKEELEGKKQKPAVPDFDPYKSHVMRIVPQPRGGKSAIQRELDTLQEKKEKLIEGSGVPERNVAVYRPGQVPRQQQGGVVEEASSGSSDLNIIATASRMRTMKQKQDENFRTKAMRDLEELRKSKVYQKTLIRVQFPDRSVFEGSFSPRETVSDLVGVLNQSILDQTLHSAYYLYISPPKTTLALETTFAASNLMPAALIYLGWNDKGACPGQNYLGYTSTSTVEYPQSLKIAQPDSSKSVSSPSTISNTGSSSSSSSAAAARTSKKPKWFKL
mmetsp:Transcript_31801/g.50768  ORF Transcript_31801/g.50768 Transcript_31801/m.50768 type:complete len:610 (-) Transcript_31801:222-2051(-)